jgi:hypothetical protein
MPASKRCALSRQSSTMIVSSLSDLADDDGCPARHQTRWYQGFQAP